MQISREGEGKIWVKTTIPFSKRYLKYLTGCADLFRVGYTDVCQFTCEKT